MEEGTVLRWLKQVGDDVAVGDELVEIETDKANMVYESDGAGTLTEIVAQEGETLPIGEVIARLGEPGEAKAAGDGGAAKTAPAPEEDERQAAEQAAAAPEEPAAQPAAGAPAAGVPQADRLAAEPTPAATPEADGSRDGAEAERLRASPIARRIAGQRGIDLRSLSGSGPGGRIVKADVERALESGAAAAGPGAAPAGPTAPAPPGAPAAAPAAPAAPTAPTAGAREKPETAKGSTEAIELTKLQQTIARRMAESKATAPHFYLDAEIDMTAAVEARAGLKEIAGEDEVVPSINDMIVKACALALREHPRANGAYRDGRFEHYSRINVGIAVAARGALVVPTVFDADRKGLRQIAAEVRSMAARVREGTITPPELSGGTFTVSNLGMYGISNFQAVINPPQAAILAVGEVKAKPVVAEDGSFVARQMMGVNLACDHRILYGADGALFLARVRDLLKRPLSLAL